MYSIYLYIYLYISIYIYIYNNFHLYLYIDVCAFAFRMCLNSGMGPPLLGMLTFASWEFWVDWLRRNTRISSSYLLSVSFTLSPWTKASIICMSLDIRFIAQWEDIRVDVSSFCLSSLPCSLQCSSFRVGMDRQLLMWDLENLETPIRRIVYE